MNLKRFKKYYIWSLPILFSLFIFSNSLQQGSSSGSLSKQIALFLLNLSPIKFSFDSFHHFIRKAAHFLEYFALAFTVILAREKSNIKRIPPTLVFWILVPLLDEALQHFVPGRYGSIFDSLLDMCGFSTCFLIHFLLKKQK